MNQDVEYNVDLDTIENRVSCSCSCSCDNNNDARGEMLKKIKCYNFAIIELRFISGYSS